MSAERRAEQRGSQLSEPPLRPVSRGVRDRRGLRAPVGGHGRRRLLALCAASFLDAIARLRERPLRARPRISRPAGAPAGAPELRPQLLGARRVASRPSRTSRTSTALSERLLRGRHAARVEHGPRRQAGERGRARGRPRAHRALGGRRARRLPVRAQGARASRRRRGRRSSSAPPARPLRGCRAAAQHGALGQQRGALAGPLRSPARDARQGRLPRLLRRLHGRRRHLPRHRSNGERGRAHAAHVHLPKHPSAALRRAVRPAPDSPRRGSSTAGSCSAWVASLASRDTSGNALWDAGFDSGAHPAGVVAGDTLYAASKVLAVRESRAWTRVS